ncbi:MAG: phytoene/squalene synthase family protein [Deltaproteobacteria bacterium]|nr:phytoene/squalene synthase family protein [Deltaproteobacteria bacterium]
MYFLLRKEAEFPYPLVNMSLWVQNDCNLKVILKGVSRSFYLSLLFLPKKIRYTMGVGYLFCRAADTIADTDLIPASERLKMLELYRREFLQGENLDDLEQIQNQVVGGGGLKDEEELIKNLPACFSLFRKLGEADQQFLKNLVVELTLGMEMDLKKFSGSASPLTAQELDQYTYYVAGVVGKFWTEVITFHFASLRKWDLTLMVDLGIRFGKGLQRVNILRDRPQDQARGRLYLPIAPIDLVQEKVKAEELLEAGWRYVQKLPWWAARLRWVCLIPLLLGFKTLKLLEENGWESGAKVSRSEVYRIMLFAAFFFWSPRLLGQLTLEPGLRR